MSKKRTRSVLGVFVSDLSLEAVLLRQGENEYHVVQRFVRQRIRKGEMVGDLAVVVPGLKDVSEADFTIQVGDGSNQPGDDLFMSTEFDGLTKAKKTAEPNRPYSRRPSVPIRMQLQDILSECEKLGFPSPKLVYCIGSTDISYTELIQPQVESSKRKSSSALPTALDTRVAKVSSNERKKLTSILADQFQNSFDRERVVFMNMVPEGDHKRYLAIVPRLPDNVISSIESFASARSRRTTSTHVVDTEVSLYLALAQRAIEVTDEEVSAIVRVGVEDTLIMFVQGKLLLHFERLRSLTSYEPMDTVCSRVLLKQDECKIGKIDHILMLTEDRRENSLTVVQEFFERAKVHSMQELLSEHPIVFPEEEGSARPATVIATAVGLRLLEGWDATDKDRFVNLLPARLRGKRKRQAPFAWHTVLMMAVLFGVTFMYTWRFMSQREEIQMRSEELRLNPPEFPDVAPAMLQAKVDSLARTYAGHQRALVVIDSLLQGSDKWSSSLAQMSSSTNAIRRLWLKSWTPIDAASVRIEGNSLSRARIARLAEEWQGSIEKLNFGDIQGIRVYSFIMTVPIRNDIPEVAMALREQALIDLDEQTKDALVSAGGSQ